jgi:hypothetical protein
LKLRPLILLLALVSVPLSRNISMAQGDETKIIALENLWNQMQINHDADAMGKLLDSDFVLTDYDGAVLTKGNFWRPFGTSLRSLPSRCRTT